ncbi:periodic tryptophan protein 1 homolog [Tachypleus tridentatus]|uniref:periodic tryptophan protein 1 homolog n=1 Tax=Tachypleus tridentatus TaxID=6853 RepID=UPI003FD6AC11
MNFVPCVAWIKKGIAKAVPDKVQLTKEELKKLIIEAKEGIFQGETENDEIEDDLEKEDEGQEAAEQSPIKDDDDIIAQYGLDGYDEEETTNTVANLAGLTVYGSNDDDPLMTNNQKDEESEEEQDFRILPTDNLIAVGRVQEDCSVLEIYVYNESEENFYVHHDVILPAFPLALEWLDFDAADGSPGNLLAIGDMTPVINIWDIDIVDTLQPAYSLGQKSNKKKLASTSSGHTDAVIDLNWNHLIRHILASGSADNRVAIWDLAEGTPVVMLESHHDKVQTLKWHPQEAQTLLTGSCDKTVKIFDCRNGDENHKNWFVNEEIERVLWDHFNPFHFYVSTECGMVYYMDSRTDLPVISWKAHNDATTGLSLSVLQPRCLVTGSPDNTVKIWDVQKEQAILVEQRNFKLGAIYTVKPSPDSAFVIAIGGDNRSDSFKVWDIRESDKAREHFVPSSQQVSSTSVEGTTSSARATDDTVMDTDSTSFLMKSLTSKSSYKKSIKKKKKKKI